MTKKGFYCWQIFNARHFSHPSLKVTSACLLQQLNNIGSQWGSVMASCLIYAQRTKKRGPEWREFIRWGAPRSLLCFSRGLLTCSNKLPVPWVVFSASPPADAYIVTEARDRNISRFLSSDANGGRGDSGGIIYRVRRRTAAGMDPPLTCMCWSCAA